MSSQIKCSILAETDNALKVSQTTSRDNGDVIETWIPRSQCDHISKGPINTDGTRSATVTLADWLVAKHNFEAE